MCKQRDLTPRLAEETMNINVVDSEGFSGAAEPGINHTLVTFSIRENAGLFFPQTSAVRQHCPQSVPLNKTESSQARRCPSPTILSSRLININGRDISCNVNKSNKNKS